jgi:D-glycero-alpha-D-manno-heptose 1-phosphate guanylyltransferase
VRETAPLGTAGGFLNACAQASFAEPISAWLVLNGDSLTITGLQPLLRLAADPEADGGILGVSLEDASRYGTLKTDGNGWIQEFREKQPGSGLINAGVYLLKSPVVREAPTKRPLSFEVELFPGLLKGGKRLRAVECRASFLDIGTPETLRQGEEFVRENVVWF